MQSMTGFGRGESAQPTFTLQVEIKSLNHRFQEILLRLPRRYQGLEERVRRALQERFHRGRFEVQARLLGIPPERAFLSADLALAEQYLRVARHLKATLGLSGEVTINDLLRFREIFNLTETTPELEDLWQEFEPAFSQALEELEAMRRQEGAYLREILEKHLADLDRLLDQLETLKKDHLPQAQKQLETRILKLLQGQELDPLRLHQEAVILADRIDFSEELDRLRSHRQHFSQVLSRPGPHGRKLDFLCQEMFREITTLANKAASAVISQVAVEIKTVIEKLREQVQNLE